MMKDFSTQEKKDFFLNFVLKTCESVKEFFDTMPKYVMIWNGLFKCGKTESHHRRGSVFLS